MFIAKNTLTQLITVLPVYKAHSFERILTKGGRTKPWLVIVNEGNSLVPYVVKMFHPTLIDTMDSVSNEVIGNVLAKEFEINTPDAALIEMDNDFRLTISDMDAFDYFEMQDDRLKFGTKYLSPAIEFQPNVFNISEIKEITEIDSVFAFDNFIINGDRTAGKPNFLISNKNGYIIDHELSLKIDMDNINQIVDKYWTNSFYQYHIFYNYLRKSWKKRKVGFFDLFAEYLRFLNINKLDTYFEQLVNEGYGNKKHAFIKEYLQKKKADSANFAKLMRYIIS